MKKENAQPRPPAIPLIAENLENNIGYRDTLDRIAAVLQLLTEIDLSEDWSPKAKTGHYWILLMLIDSVNYVSSALADEITETKEE